MNKHITGSSTPSSEPKTPSGKAALRQAKDALDNVSQGYDSPPPLINPAGSADRFESPSQGETEPTHVPQLDSDGQ